MTVLRRGRAHKTPRALLLFNAILSAVFLACSFNAWATDGVSPYHVTVAMRSELQHLLELHRSIRLDADEDYRSQTLQHLVVATGERIEGAWNTRVPVIVVPGGVSDITISHVRSDARFGPDVIFEAGGETSDIKVIGGTGGAGTNIRVAVHQGARLNRIELLELGGLNVDLTQAGYIRNSIFARLLGYWPGPQVDWHGNLAELSGNNVFLGFSSITPQRGSTWVNPGDLSLIGLDCESWGLHEDISNACFSVRGRGRIAMIGASGGTSRPDRVGALASFDDDDAVSSWMFHGQGGSRDGADLVLTNIAKSLFVETAPEARVRDEEALAQGNIRQHWIDPTPSARPQQDRTAAPVKQTGAVVMAAAFWSGVWPTSQTKPVRRSLQEPQDIALAALSSQPDSSIEIQSRIDRDGVIRLNAGTYYLDHPLKIGSRNRVEGILGVDRERVVLVAKGDFAIIEGRGDFHPTRDSEGQIVNLTFDGLTLYGGRYGFNWTDASDNFGDGGTIAFSSFANLKLMHQRIAGVNADGIHGLDSNSWYRVDLVSMPVAFRGQGRGMSGAMAYADKQSFVDCQFQNIADAVWYWTSDRPSGNEVWKDDYFFHVGALSKTRSARSLLWANSVMENVFGPVGMQVTDTGSTVTDYFFQYDCLWKGQGPPVVTDTQSNGLGALFIQTHFEQSGSTLVAREGKQSLFLWDSSVAWSVPMKNIDQGVFVNSRLGPTPIQSTVIRQGAPE